MDTYLENALVWWVGVISILVYKVFVVSDFGGCYKCTLKCYKEKGSRLSCCESALMSLQRFYLSSTRLYDILVLELLPPV